MPIPAADPLTDGVTATISGPVKLPGGLAPLEGTWYARIRTLNGATIDSDGTIRGGIQGVYDDGDGAVMVLPLGSYEFRFESSNINPHTGQRDQYGWYPFDLVEDTLWGVIMETPVEVPVTPSDVTRAEAARDTAEQFAADAQVAAESVYQIGTDNDTAVAGAVNTTGTAREAVKNAATTVAVTIKEAPLSPFRYGLTVAMEGDPSAVAAVTAAFQATINALPASQGAMLIPRGSWFCSGLKSQGRQFDIHGLGRQVSALRLVHHAGTATPMIHILADTAPNYGAGVIRDFTIGLASGVEAATPGACIKVEGAYAADIGVEDMWLGGGSVGVWWAGATNGHVSRTTIEGCQGSGIYAENSKLLSFDTIQTFQNNANGIELQNCQSIEILGGKHIENYGNGLLANSGGAIKVVGGLWDNNSKQFAYNPAAPGFSTYDNIRYMGVNKGEVTATAHVSSLGQPWAKRAVYIDPTSYHVSILGGEVDADAVTTDSFVNLSENGQVITRDRVQLRSPIKIGGMFLRDGGGLLQQSANGSTWTNL
ncbi:right-handed parallel beta-helix repeat-containing protein [Nocardioides aurantiacus]|uniref:Right handed beta helix domain-containing protein n=1 Tax=Nocardioides aurantiacus TaxID=86796 RepID=A0A3N2CW49_9ACTN|nr:right-handed parallel beta-helix repeat-containing protein [Nocardioides aurantiacus]ROR91785.1 hypothetical protein EDD33_2660 [Nocardioides aurantiacus]